MMDFLIMLGLFLCEGLIVFAVYLCLSERRKSPFARDKGRSHIFIRNGVDTATLAYGRDKGDAFYGDVRSGTMLASGRVRQIVSLRIFNQGTGMTRQFYFHEKFVIGRFDGHSTRDKYCIAHDPYVSKNHCELFLQNNRVYVRDLSAHNRTYLNGKEVRGWVPLKSGDILSIGYTKLRVSYTVL